MTTPIITKDYAAFFEDLKHRVVSSRYKAALRINMVMQIEKSLHKRQGQAITNFKDKLCSLVTD